MRMITISAVCMILGVGCGLDTSTVVKTGEDARSKIESRGVALPASATNLYYAFQPQFANYLDTWISFTANPTDCLSVAQAVAGTKKKTPVFVSGTRSREDYVTAGPRYDHPEYASIYWDLGKTTNGTMFETDGLFIMIDKDKNRIHISLKAPASEYRREDWKN